MPQENDYEFGKAAVGSGQLQQEQLEECVEVLVALERVGSQQRLWDVVRRKGYMSAPAIAQVRQAAGGAAASSISTPSGKSAQDLPAGPVGNHAPKPSAAETSMRFETHGIPPPEKEEDWKVPDAIEVEPVTDPLMRPGAKGVRADSSQLLSPRAYRPGQLQVSCVNGSLKGRQFVLSRPVTVIGREKDVDILIDETGVSRHHAEFVLDKTHAELRDAGSKNGVHVNGARVASATLRAGDAIRIGKCLFILEEVVPPKKS